MLRGSGRLLRLGAAAPRRTPTLCCAAALGGSAAAAAGYSSTASAQQQAGAPVEWRRFAVEMGTGTSLRRQDHSKQPAGPALPTPLRPG